MAMEFGVLDILWIAMANDLGLFTIVEKVLVGQNPWWIIGKNGNKAINVGGGGIKSFNR